MKKLFAIGLSFLLMVAAMLALSVSSMAAGTPTTQVKLGSTTLTASSPTMTAGEGTATFDAASGTLTLNNATGLGAITGTDGDLTILAYGENTLSATGTWILNGTGNITFGGTGCLTLTGAKAGIYSTKGHITIKDSIRFTMNCAMERYVLGTSGAYDIIFQDDCVVDLTGGGAGIIFQKTSDGNQKVVVQGNASVTVNTESCNDSGAAVRGAVSCSELQILSGSLTVNSRLNVMSAVDCANYTQSGGAVTVNATEATDFTVVCNRFALSGGTMTVSSKSAAADVISCTDVEISGGEWSVTADGTSDSNAVSVADCATFTQQGGTVAVQSSQISDFTLNCTDFLQTNGTFTLNAENVGADGICAVNFEKSGGDMTVAVEGNTAKTKIQGIKIVGDGTTVTTLSGGALTITMSSLNASATDTPAFYLHKVAEANFCGTDVTLNITTPKVGSFSSAILTGWTKSLNITDGEIVANLSENTTGLISPRLSGADFVLNISGGTLTGTAPSLLNTAVGGDTDNTAVTTCVAVNVTEGATIHLATAGGAFSSAAAFAVDATGSTASFLDGCGLIYGNEYLITSNAFAAGEILTDVVIVDKDASVTLNYGLRTYCGSVGLITLDPDAKTLTFDGVAGVVSVSVPQDVSIQLIGTNLIGSASGSALTVDGSLTLTGSGSLELTGESNVLSAESVVVSDAELRIVASLGTTVNADSLVAKGASRIRVLAENGTGLALESLALNDTASVQIYADMEVGLLTDSLSVRDESSLTVDALSTGLALNGDALIDGSATVLIYSEFCGVTAGSSTITVGQTASFTVKQDGEAATGILLCDSSIIVEDSANFTVNVSGIGVSVSENSNGALVVNGGTMTIDGIPAIDKNVAVTAFYMEGGEGSWNSYRLLALDGTENYVRLSSADLGAEFKPADPVTVVLEATVSLTGKTMKENDFEFVLMNGDEILQTIKSNAKGNVIFEGIEYTEAGVHTYTVKQVKGEAAGVTYDESVYTVTVTVTSESGTLTATIDTTPAFQNSYKVPFAEGEIVDGKYIFTETAKATEMGLIKIGDDHYYVGPNGVLVTSQKYYAWRLNENCTDINVGWYYFNAEGKLVTDGIVDGYYYVDGKPTEMGLFQYTDGNYYVAQYDGKIITDRYFVWKIDESASQFATGWYDFNEDGTIIPWKNGIHDGYYYVNDKPTEMGLFEYEGKYYVAQYDGKIITGKYYVWKTQEGLEDLKGWRYFDETTGELLNGVVGEYYYENGKRVDKGLIEWDGSYYFAQSGGKLVTSENYTKYGAGKYYVWKVDESAKDAYSNGWYFFDENGKLIIE